MPQSGLWRKKLLAGTVRAAIPINGKTSGCRRHLKPGGAESLTSLVNFPRLREFASPTMARTRRRTALTRISQTSMRNPG